MVLAFSFDLAFSLECVSARRCQALFQAKRSRGKNATARTLLDRIYSGFLYLLYDARVLLDAMLPGVRAIAGLRDGRGQHLDSPGNAGARCRRWDCRCGLFLDPDR